MRVARCPICATEYDITSLFEDKRIKCTSCGAILKVPRPKSYLFEAVGISIIVVLIVLGLFLLFARTHEPVLDDIAVSKQPAPPQKNVNENDQLAYAKTEWENSLNQTIYKLRAEFGLDNFVLKPAKPFLLLLQRGHGINADELVEDYSRALGQLNTTFYKIFGAKNNLQPIERALPVIILNSRESYDDYCRRTRGMTMPRLMSGIYEPVRKRVVMYHEKNFQFERLLHEATHAIVNYYAFNLKANEEVQGTFWLQEGICAIFETHQKDSKNNFIIDLGVHKQRLIDAKDAISDPELRRYAALPSLINMTTKDFWKWIASEPNEVLRDRVIQSYYAISWAFVYFMLKNQHYQDVILSYLRSELEGRAGKQEFELILKGLTTRQIDVNDLQLEFEAFIKSLN